jgi:putative transposase
MREVEEPERTATVAIGIDLGIARFATLSDGLFYAPLNSFQRHEIRLRRYQRVMSRKIRFSNNWKKAKNKVQTLHVRIGNARRDYLHKTTTTISQNHAMVCVEDLRVRNMSKSAAGTAEQPGKNVRAKSGLNKSILDQGWFEFRRQLQYKLNWRGGILVTVTPHHTSQTCPTCGHVAPENRRTQAHFQCVACGHEENADVVAAINILERGHRLLACGEAGSGPGRETKTNTTSAKQEPTEATVYELAHA